MASAALRPAAAWRARLASSRQNRPINVEPAAAEAMTARRGPLLSRSTVAWSRVATTRIGQPEMVRDHDLLPATAGPAAAPDQLNHTLLSWPISSMRSSGLKPISTQIRSSASMSISATRTPISRPSLWRTG